MVVDYTVSTSVGEELITPAQVSMAVSDGIEFTKLATDPTVASVVTVPASFTASEAAAASNIQPLLLSGPRPQRLSLVPLAVFC